MATLTKPKQGEDVRVLHRDVEKLVGGINTLTNMTAVWLGKGRGVGRLQIRGDAAELYIKIEDVGLNVGDTRTAPPITVTSNANPAAFGVTIIWSAALPTDTQGTVQFYVGGVAFGGLVTLVNGVANSDPISDLPPGDHVIRAHYGGGAVYTEGDGYLTQTVNALNEPDVNPFGSPNPVTEGDLLTLATYVLPNDPIPPAPPITGQVRFDISSEGYSEIVDLIDLGGNQWGAESTPFRWLTHGTYEVEAEYLGDGHYGYSSDTYIQVVRALVDVTMWIDPNPVHTNTNTVLHAIVTGNAGVVTGTIQFYDENGAVGTPVGIDSSGQAQLLINSGPAERTYTFQASYSGNANYAPALSEPNILYITNFPTVLYITLPPTNFGFGNYNQAYLTDPGGYNGTIRLRLYPHYPLCSFYYNPLPQGGWGDYYSGSFNCSALVGSASGILTPGGWLDLPMVNGQIPLYLASIAPVPSFGGNYFAPCSEGGIYAEFAVFNPVGGNPIAIINGPAQGVGWFMHYCQEG